MNTKFTKEINSLRENIISEILSIVGDNVIDLKYNTINCGESSFNTLSNKGASLIINSEDWGDIGYDSFSIEELNNIYLKLKPWKKD